MNSQFAGNQAHVESRVRGFSGVPTGRADADAGGVGVVPADSVKPANRPGSADEGEIEIVDGVQTVISPEERERRKRQRTAEQREKDRSEATKGAAVQSDDGKDSIGPMGGGPKGIDGRQDEDRGYSAGISGVARSLLYGQRVLGTTFDRGINRQLALLSKPVTDPQPSRRHDRQVEQLRVRGGQSKGAATFAAGINAMLADVRSMAVSSK